MKSSYACELHNSVCLPRYSALQKENSMKVCSCHYMKIRKLRMKACTPTINMSHSEKAKGRLRFVFSVFLHFTERFIAC